MRTDEQVREGLIDLAGQVIPQQAPVAAVLGRARRYRRRRYLAVSSAMVLAAVLAATSVTRLLGAADYQLAAPAPDGPFLGWQPAGDAVTSSLGDRVVQVWDAAAAGDGPASPEPHTQARILLATRSDALGLVVIAQAYDGSGAPRIGFFTGGPGDGNGLILRADRPAPDPVDTKVVSLVSARLQGPDGTASDDYWGAYGIALAMPGVTSVQMSSTTIDEEMRAGGGGRSAPFRIQPLPISSTALTTTITGFHGRTRLFTAPADGGAFGDAEPLAGRVLVREADTLTVSVADTARIRPGQFAATREGLVGRVASVDPVAKKVVIEAANAAGFASPAYTDISNHSGRVVADGTALRMEDLPSDAGVNPGNRVLVPDPAQRDNRAGALTIGRVSATSPSVRLALTVNLAELQDLSIMVPPDR